MAIVTCKLLRVQVQLLKNNLVFQGYSRCGVTQFLVQYRLGSLRFTYTLQLRQTECSLLNASQNTLAVILLILKYPH